MIIRTGIGQDSHRFLGPESSKPCVLGGVIFENVSGLAAKSDGDVIFHAICNSITSLTGVLILGGIADELYSKDGITDSQVYVKKALEGLGNQKITHVALTIEGKHPYFKPRLQELKNNIAAVMNLQSNQVGITATTGEGLTDFGCGDGLQCLCVITTMEQ